MDVVALGLNTLLLYLIINYSSFRMKPFKGIFLLACLSDICLSGVVLLGQPYNIFDGGYMFLVSNGYLSCRYPLLDHLLMVAFCSTLHAHMVMLAIQFVWRNKLVCDDKSVIKFGKNAIVLPVVWCFLQVCTATWCWVFDQRDLREIGREILRHNGWQFTNETAPYPALTAAGSSKLVIHNAFYLGSAAIAYTVIIVCQVGVHRYFHRMGLPSHQSTERAYAEINRALVLLAITPLLGLIPTAIAILAAALNIPDAAISVYASLGMTAVTVINPIMTTWVVRPYRRGLGRLLRLNVPEPVTPSVTVE
ncbi:7TM GPCR protein [Aphelenchoides avenae]|nr:7TM GPCR protein [Aphelenchus avenae]